MKVLLVCAWHHRVNIPGQRTSWDFIVLYWAFDWLDLKMLESIVSVLPSDWFSLSGWPSFSKCTVRHRVRIDTLNVILYYNLQRLVGNSGWWKKNLASLKDIYNRSFIGHQFRVIYPGFSIRNGVDGRIWEVGGEILKDCKGVFSERHKARASRRVRGHAPPENFENLGLLECISRILGHA